MGFDVDTFDKILEVFQEEWHSSTILQNDTSSAGAPRLGAHSLDAAGALGITLHLLNSTMQEISLQQIFALIPTTISHYLNFAMQILELVLRKIQEARIQWPKSQAMAEYARIIRERDPALAMFVNGTMFSAFGSIDGLKCPVGTSEDIVWENASYNGWLQAHVCNSVIAFSPKGECLS